MNEKLRKVAIACGIAIPVVGLTAYCGVKIFHTGNSTNHQAQQFVQKKLSESDRVWGAIPSSACAALANANVITTPYSLLDAKKKLYGCTTTEIEIPNQKNKKTLQYTVTGFNDKATNIKLVMRITGNQNTDEAVMAKKSWVIYSAVLAQTVFSQQLSEEEMQKMVQLSDGESIKKNYNLQLVSDAQYLKEKNIGIYTYEIRGLPVLSGE